MLKSGNGSEHPLNACDYLLLLSGEFRGFCLVGSIFFNSSICQKQSSVQVKQMFKLILSCCAVLPNLKCSG